MMIGKYLVSAAALLVSAVAFAAGAARPNIVLVMADDMGWGQTGYYHHPVLKTPNLDAMAAAGLRLDRFYAGAPNCSPTRATVMTGRSNDRAGVENHGYALRRQEKTLPRAMREAGYATGHFGKWHLNGYRGPGAPILASDTHNPGAFGYDEWLAVTNFFDRDPLLSRKGRFEEFKGDSSEIVVDEGLKFIEQNRAKPFFVSIWFGSPHAPMVASDTDRSGFAALEPNSAHHYGELVAMDRAIGTLRRRLRELGLADNTVVWFNSDNGGLPEIKPGTVGDLRGFKNTMYEGGLRVPAVIEWPSVIKTPRVSRYPAGTVDIFPTIADLVGLPKSALLGVVDGTSIKPLFTQELPRREKPLVFRHQNRAALVDNRYKILNLDLKHDKFELYDLEADPKETEDISAAQPEVAQRMRTALMAFHQSVEASVAGKDYPEGRLLPGDPASRDWMTAPEYAEYLPLWKDRPEFRQSAAKGKKKKSPDE